MRSLSIGIIKHYNVMIFLRFGSSRCGKFSMHASVCKNITKIRNEYSFRS